ncbi:MAG: c-type cytochrome [Acidobacteriota bacterium]
MPEPPSIENDPVTSKSLSGPLLLSAILLTLSLVWALYDEIYGQRPWKDIQERFVRQYTSYLKRLKPRQAEQEKAVRASAEYRRLEIEVQDAERAVAARNKEIEVELKRIERRLSAVTETFSLARSRVSALIYEVEVAENSGSKQSLNRDIEEYKKGPFRISLATLDDSGKTERVNLSYAQLEEEFSNLQSLKARLMAERSELLRPISEARQKLDAHLKEQLAGLSEQQVAGLLRKMEGFEVKIKQIHIREVDLVDRCESCHLGIREPLTLTKADLGNEAAFISHPSSELLQIHDPERFGCTPCHNGNGVATTSIKKAHGRYKHWLWPLYHKENMEAGCNQCHNSDLVLDHAEVLGAGKELFRSRGCMGCHRYEGFDNEADALINARQTLRRLDGERKETERTIEKTIQEADAAADNDEAKRLYAKADAMRQGISLIDHQMEQEDVRSRSLLREIKKVAPSLKEVRVKLRKEWIPVWLENPHAYRPTTKMPAFRLEKDQREAIAALIWQSGVEGQLAVQKKGDVLRGKELFETRGCLGCHSVGEGDQALGGTFAANLSRVGEKANYDYLVRWIHNPRERTRPFCPHEKRDLGPEDYQKKGLPFVFDLEHTRCPNDGHELQVQQMTVMPNLRLTWEEAQDIASYLMTLKGSASYPQAAYLDDPQMKAKGLAWAKHFGCAGCHEIAGLEEEGRIGTELTKEGSQPIERLDFALLTHQAKHEGWYNHKGFFEHKLENPAVYDQGKVKAPLEKLRMPNFKLKPSEIGALTTFLLGSVDSTLPPHFFYSPKDQRQDIREGWWLINKYNCMGCHQVRLNQRSVLSTLPRYQDPDWKEQLPPTLIGEGARVDPNWLARFLENPSMSQTDLNRNGVRGYLKVRMPTFSFSKEEIRKIVRFFEALSSQAQPYIPTKLDPLSDKERDMARQLFTSNAAPCLKCHATGDPNHDRTATAPNFLLARERLKPGWTERWLSDPAMMAPGTSMPSGLFRREGSRWIFNGPLPPSFSGYERDHRELLVRYMFQFTPEEQRRLLGRGGAGGITVARR